MLTPLRRYEFGKTLLGLASVVVAAGVASKLFTGAGPMLIIVYVLVLSLVLLAGILILPPRMDMDSKKERK